MNNFQFYQELNVEKYNICYSYLKPFQINQINQIYWIEE